MQKIWIMRTVYWKELTQYFELFWPIFLNSEFEAWSSNISASVIVSKHLFANWNILHTTLFTKCEERDKKQADVFCFQFPLSMNGTPGTITPLLTTKNRLAFYDSGSPSN